MTMERITDDVVLIDVEHMGRPRSIAAGLLEGDDGVAVVDPGPESAMDGLLRGLDEAGYGVADIRAVLLTHIHLDHAGATGRLVERNPEIRVRVHRRGAPHVIDPSRLLESALRIYGEQLVPLFGAVLPVPESNVQVLEGGETLDVLGRTLDVAYTPGHASHHVSYLDRRTGTAFVGDTAGLRIHGLPFILPVTPPPDIDPELWRESIGRIREWGPDRIFLTHFGPAADVDEHFARLEAGLERWAEAVRRSLEEEGSDAERARAFAERVMTTIPDTLPEADAEYYRRGAGLEDSWHGLARYWRKRNAG